MSGRSLSFGCYLLPLMLLPLAGCDNGTTTPDTPPEVVAISPVGAIGAANAVVTFSATVTGEVTEWTWDFDRATIPQTSGAENPMVALIGPGDFQGTLTVCNAAGCSDPFPFDFTIAPSAQAPVIQSVQPTGAVGKTGDTVTFTITTDRVASGWSWDLGGGATPNVSGEEELTVTLGAPGTYTGTVVACIPTLVACSRETTFSYTVAAP